LSTFLWLTLLLVANAKEFGSLITYLMRALLLDVIFVNYL